MHAMASEAAFHAAMGMTMPGMEEASSFGPLWVMWTVMMVAMMLPSAAPVALLVLRTYRGRGDHLARMSSVLFVLGYLVVWAGYSVVAAGAQVWLHRAALLTPEMATASGRAAAGILLVAGVYQLLPIKTACLRHCRSPLDFLTRHWREGAGGALSMGMRHGAFCVGCCWALMALLFVAGVMNLIWIAAIAGFVLVEKYLQSGVWVSRLSGLALAGWALAVLFFPGA